MSEELFIHEFSPYCRMVDGFREWGHVHQNGGRYIRFDKKIGDIQKGTGFYGQLSFRELADLYRERAHEDINWAFEHETQ